MALRDLLIAAIVFGTLPFVFKRPWLGIILWSWIGYMNPHRLAFGFALDFPWAMWIGLTTLVVTVFTRDKQSMPWTGETIFLLLFNVWIFITTLAALDPESAWYSWDKVMKIQLMTFVTMLLINNPKKLIWLVWIIAISLGFYGVKGGIFTISTGGEFRVWGPSGAYIEGNNEIALALIIVAPLFRFLQMNTPNKWIKRALLVAMGLTMVAAIGSQSRGALVAISAMGFFLWTKTRNKFTTGFYGIALIIALAFFMPQSWHDRMDSIKDYKTDASAMGRINAWHVAFNIAKNRITGAGFEAFNPQTFAMYAPDPDDVHDVHSIYFEVLGEHGFIGLFLWLMMWGLTWRTGNATIRRCRGRPELRWGADLAATAQVCLMGYAAGGAFLGLAYFDLPYHIMAIIVLADRFTAAATKLPAATARASPTNMPVPAANRAILGPSTRAG
jgi:putative inorganic carbon (hco3(-)) transporter